MADSYVKLYFELSSSKCFTSDTGCFSYVTGILCVVFLHVVVVNESYIILQK